MTVSDNRALLARYGLRPKKSWGQNFLQDETARRRIVEAARLSPEDVAVEIGPGLGALTGLLLEAAGRVVVVERDPDMVRVLEGELGSSDKLEIESGDAMAFDFAAAAAQAGRSLVVIGNLPYQITSPLLFKILEAADAGAVVKRAVLMVQREFAERMAAAPDSKTYGRLSVMVQQLAVVRVMFHVGSHAFVPRPAVTSSVFTLEPRATPLAPVQDRALFAAVVRAGFGARRKMLRRALEPAFGEAAAQAALAAAGIEGTRRAETLDVAAFARLADGLFAAGARAPALSSDTGDDDACSPEVETIVRGLRPKLVGARVVDTWWSGLPLRLGQIPDQRRMARFCRGGVIAGLRRRGKYILCDIEGAAAGRGGLVFHLGMSGRLRVQAASAPREKHTHVVLELGGARELRFVDPRRFGCVVPTAAPDEEPEILALGPDPFEDLTAVVLGEALAGSRAPVKAFLLDQTRVAGLGNIYVCEALFRAGVHPATEARRVRGRAEALFEAIRTVLQLGLDNRGTTLRDYVDAEGGAGGNQAALLVYGREGAACAACGAPVKRRVDAARSTFFCARCQRR